MTWNLFLRDHEAETNQLKTDAMDLLRNYFPFSDGSFFESEWIPRIDVRESDKKITVIADLPGLARDDIEVIAERNSLTLSGRKSEESVNQNEKQRSIVSERRFGSFRRIIQLPDGLNNGAISAEFKDGVLTIDIPRDEKNVPSKISIKAR